MGHFLTLHVQTFVSVGVPLRLFCAEAGLDAAQALGEVDTSSLAESRGLCGGQEVGKGSSPFLQPTWDGSFTLQVSGNLQLGQLASAARSAFSSAQHGTVSVL